MRKYLVHKIMGSGKATPSGRAKKHGASGGKNPPSINCIAVNLLFSLVDRLGRESEDTKKTLLFMEGDGKKQHSVSLALVLGRRLLHHGRTADVSLLRRLQMGRNIVPAAGDGGVDGAFRGGRWRHEVGAHVGGRRWDRVHRRLPFSQVVFGVVEDLAGLRRVLECGADVSGDDYLGVSALGSFWRDGG